METRHDRCQQMVYYSSFMVIQSVPKITNARWGDIMNDVTWVMTAITIIAKQNANVWANKRIKQILSEWFFLSLQWAIRLQFESSWTQVLYFWCCNKCGHLIYKMGKTVQNRQRIKVDFNYNELGFWFVDPILNSRLYI